MPESGTPEAIATNRVVVVAYDRSWATRGIALADDLRAALGPQARRVEHIGSTSIPGMTAKPILDMQVSVDDLDLAAGTFSRPLADRGFQRQPYDQDHVPAGCDDDPTRWAKQTWARRGHAGGSVNLHVRRRGAPNERLALLFRDWFRAHPEAIPAYARFKQALSQAVDGETYTDIKDPVVDLVIAVAESWVSETGWKP